MRRSRRTSTPWWPRRPPPPTRCRRRGPRGSDNEPRFEIRTPLHQLTGVDLTQLDVIGPYTALRLLAEIGTDMSRWPTEKHFTSWLTLAPQIPSFMSSPWIRGAPHKGLASAIRATRARTSALTRGRPPGALERTDQYWRKRRRCHRRTVSGVTITRACFHPVQTLARTEARIACRRRAAGAGRGSPGRADGGRRRGRARDGTVGAGGSSSSRDCLRFGPTDQRLAARAGFWRGTGVRGAPVRLARQGLWTAYPLRDREPIPGSGEGGEGAAAREVSVLGRRQCLPLRLS